MIAKKKLPALAANNGKKVIFLAAAFLLLVVGLWNTLKPLPEGLSYKGQVRMVTSDDVIFLSDETYTDKEGTRFISQSIFNYVLSMIQDADSFIMVDMFLWNSFGDDKVEPYRTLASELSYALIEKKKQSPDIEIIVISDPINSSYGGHPSLHFDAMKAVGINVVWTHLPSLRDSNPLYSVFWRTFIYPIDVLHRTFLRREYTVRVLPSLLGSGEGVTLRSYLQLLNFKANHRKLIVADNLSKNGDKKVTTLVTSANPHNGSSAHSNVAVVVTSALWRDAIESERAVMRLVGDDDVPLLEPKEEKGDVSVQLLTEGMIKEKVIEMIANTEEGNTIKLFMFYLSDMDVITALKDAAKRNVEVSVILDPNKDAFGREKNGVPNRSVAEEMVSQTEGKIKVRWCLTKGEQCHTKLLLVETPSEEQMLLGSANYTRRNIGDYNLESNVYVAGNDVTAILKAGEYFDRAWGNSDNRVYTVEYEAFRDTSLWHRMMWKVMETTGLGTF